MKKNRSIYAMLLIAILLFIAGCGGSGSNITSASNDAKTAKVSLAFQFPDEEAGKSVISKATTHILINVWQWKKRIDGTLELVNFTNKLIDKTTTSTTLDLLPTYTNICATQWKDDPRNIKNAQYLEQSKLETVCSFGLLQPGYNIINLRMIRGNWVLNTPFAFNNTTSLVSFSLYRKGYPLYEVYNYEEPQGLTDVTYYDFSSRGMAKLNWGSDYNVALKATKTYYGGNGYYIPPFNYDQPSLSIGFYSNFFNMGDTAPFFFIAKDETKDPNNPKGYALFSLPKKTDADGWFRQSKEFMEPIVNSYGTPTGRLALVDRKVEMKIEKWGGSSYNNNQTATILDPCVPTTVSSDAMTLCAGKEDSIDVPVSAFNQYSGVTDSYKVTFKVSLSGTSICYNNGGQPIMDASGNVIGCFDYNAGINYNPSVTPTCVSGTWNSTRNRCELTIQNACIQVGGTWSGSQCINMPYSSLSAMCNAINAGPNMWNWYDYTYNVCANNGIPGSIVCYDGGEYVNGRCEKTLQTACYGGTTPDPGTFYNATTKTCTYSGFTYLGKIELKQLTAIGDGKLASEITVGTAKTSDNETKFKISIPKN